jgi:hypothetical protein
MGEELVPIEEEPMPETTPETSEAPAPVEGDESSATGGGGKGHVEGAV